MQVFEQAITDHARVALFEACTVFTDPAQIVALVNADRRRKQEWNTERGVEHELARFSPQDVGIGEQRIETIEIVFEYGLVQDLDAAAELLREPRS